MTYNKVCSECVMNGDCLLQFNDDVENCIDVEMYNYEGDEEDDGEV